MGEQLKPCPFCGGYAILLHPSNADHFGYLHSVACCTEEGCRGEQFDTWYGSDEEAIEAWNTRYKRTCYPVKQVSTGYHMEDDVVLLSCGHNENGRIPECLPIFCGTCGAEVVNE